MIREIGSESKEEAGSRVVETTREVTCKMRSKLRSSWAAPAVGTPLSRDVFQQVAVGGAGQG